MSYIAANESEHSRIVADVRRVLEDSVVDRGHGFESRWVEIETVLLREVLDLLECGNKDQIDNADQTYES